MDVFDDWLGSKMFVTVNAHEECKQITSCILGICVIILFVPFFTALCWYCSWSQSNTQIQPAQPLAKVAQLEVCHGFSVVLHHFCIDLILNGSTWMLGNDVILYATLRGKMPGRGRKDSFGNCGGTWHHVARNSPRFLFEIWADHFHCV